MEGLESGIILYYFYYRKANFSTLTGTSLGFR
jgi:hypothetical protein